MGHLMCMLGFSLILSPYFSALGFFFSDDKEVGEITPENPKVLVNQTLEMNCTVFKDSGLNASLLVWVIYNDSKASPDTVFVDGERTLMFRKKITSIEEEGTYLCKRIDETDYLKSIVESVSLVIEYEAVRNVTNFNCILDEEKKEFRCSWELGKYNKEAPLNISIIMSADNGSTVLPCPKNVKFQQNCTWTKDDVDIAAILSMSKIVILNVTNQLFNVKKSFRKELITENITKPLPTEYINASSLNSCGCANVSWGTIPGGVKTSSQVILTSQWNSAAPLLHNVDLNKSLVVCNLIPATTYTVEVRIKPMGGLYYSEPRQDNFDTCETAPSLAPSMQSSGYSSGICNSGNRSVTVYWEKIPRKFQNGHLKEYRVSLANENWKRVAPNASSGTIDIPCGGSHNVSVQGCNRRGCSPDSSIYIPVYKDVVSLKRVIVEQIGLSEVQISWFVGEREAIVAADVVWCKVKPAVLQCQDEVRMLRRMGNMNHTILQADTVGEALDDVIFGVAVINDRNISSGIKWQDECRYVKDAVPPPVESVTLLSNPPKNSLVVSWLPLKCDSAASKNAYIAMYQIIYCQLNTQGSCTGEEFSVNVPADSKTQYTLENLEAGTKYGVWVRAVSLTKEGRRSKMVPGQPTNNDLSVGSITGIVIGGIFVLLLVCAGFVFVCRLVKRKLGLDETFDIETIPVRPYENLPTGSNLFNIMITTPSERSSSPLITPNGTTSNGNIRHNGVTHNYEEVLPERSTVDLDEEEESGERKGSKSDLKSNVVTLAITDVPRQISKDSGHGSLSPTSTHGPPTSEESDKKENILKDILDLPPDYAKATSVTTQCVHDFEKGSFYTEEISPPDSRGTFKDSSCSSSQSSGIPVEDGYRSHADFLQNNNDKQHYEESSKKCTESDGLDRSSNTGLENKQTEVELTSGYVLYQPNGTQTTTRHHPNNVQPMDTLLNGTQTTNGNQSYDVQPMNTLPKGTQTTNGNQPNNIQPMGTIPKTTQTTNGNQLYNIQPKNTLPNNTQTFTQNQPYNIQPNNTLPIITQTTFINQPNNANDQCRNIQHSAVGQLYHEQSTDDYEPDNTHQTDKCHTDNHLSTPGYQPNKTVNTEHQAIEMDSGQQLNESEQFPDYLPHDTNFAELSAFQNGKEKSLVSKCVVDDKKDLSVMDSVPSGINTCVPNGTTDNVSSDNTDYVPCISTSSGYVPNGTKDYISNDADYAPNGVSDYVPNGISDPVLSGKRNYVPDGTSDHIPKDIAGLVPNSTSDYVPNGTSDYVPNGTSDYVPNGTSDYVPNGTSDYVPNGTSDYVLNGTENKRCTLENF